MILGEGEQVLFSGKASYKSDVLPGNVLYPGTLTMTDRRLIFEPLQLYPGKGGEIAIADISDVREEPLQVGTQSRWAVTTAPGQRHLFDSGLRNVFMSLLSISRFPGGRERLCRIEYAKLKDPYTEMQAVGIIPGLYYLRRGRTARGLALILLELFTWWTILVPALIQYRESKRVVRDTIEWNQRVLEGRA